MKGIVLAGGAGTRLYPVTRAYSKQLVHVYNKPLVYYPLTTLMLGGIRDVLVVTSPQDLPLFERLLGDGSQWGIALRYAAQEAPRGLAEAFIIGERFLGGEPSCLVLGDNIFYSDGLTGRIERAAQLRAGALVFGYAVKNPGEYGVVELDAAGRVLGIEEKPAQPRSNLAVPGLYFVDGDAPRLAREQRPSARGELEITDLLRAYMARGELAVELLGRGTAWFDAGTCESLLQASLFIQAVETRQNLMIGCPEEVAFRRKFIDARRLEELARPLGSTEYGRYLARILEEP